MTKPLIQALQQTISGVYGATEYIYGDTRRTIETIGISIILFIVILLATFPMYSYQMLAAGPAYWGEMVTSLWWLVFESNGWIGFSTVIGYAFIGGITLRIAASRTLTGNRSGWHGLISMIPGAILLGCAGCGAGLIGLIAGVGPIAVLLAAGPILRGVGIVLAIYYLGNKGSPNSR